jgi:hypothetical protein
LSAVGKNRQLFYRAKEKLSAKTVKAWTKLIGRSCATVRLHRRNLGRPPHNPVWKPWAKTELELLGKFTDTEVAARTGHPAGSVKMQRCKLGIPCCDSKRRPWLPAEDALLGKLSDQEVSRQTKRTFAAVRTRRIARGLTEPAVGKSIKSVAMGQKS